MATPASKTVVKSAGAVGSHSFLREEQVAFTEHINYCLGKDDFLKGRGYLPMSDSNDLFRASADGILLCKLINLAQADTVDERALNIPDDGKKLNPWEMSENQNIVINSAKGIGCQVVNIHAKDLISSAEEHKEYLVLGLIWQIVKIQLLSQISIKDTPELVRLLAEGEELKDMLKLPPEEILVRWVNYHLAKEGLTRRVTNLSGDLKDGEVYLALLHSLDAGKCPKDAAMASSDPSARAAAAIDNAKAIEVPCFVHPGDITSGNKRLNLAFMAQIFNTRHGLEMSATEKKGVEEAFEAAGLSEESDGDAREERVFRMWMNSMSLGGGEITIQRLADDLNDGLLLIEALEKVVPGTVDDKKVNGDRAKLNRFKKVENCNYAVQLGKSLGFSLPGIGGVDIAGGNPKLVLGFVWQLMRLQVVRMLQAVGGGEVPKDADIIAWANGTVSGAGKATHIDSFKDASIASGVFLLDLLTAVEPRAVNPSIPTAGETPEDKARNAKYVISVARKIGASVYCTWEDIRDVKPKMIMTLVASIMSRAKELAAKK